MKHGNYAEFTAFGVYCGEFIDDLVKSGAQIWDISGSGSIYTMRTVPQNYMSVARKARKYRVKTAVVKRGGGYFRLRRYRKRLGIPAGILAFFAVIVIMSNFIWDIRITGNQTVTKAQIAEQLEKSGIRAGAAKKSFNANKAEIEMSLALDDLAWVSIERAGSRLNVKVSERLPSGSDIPTDVPCNVIADRSGQIISTEIYRGKLLYPMRSGVNKGDVIVSGVVSDGAGGLIFVHADAKIIAECTETVEFYQPYENYLSVKNGYGAVEKSVVFLGMNFTLNPFGAKKNHKGDNIKYSEEIRAPKIFGFPLPYRELTQNYEYYDRVQITDSAEDTLEKLNNSIDLYERNFLSGAEIIAREAEYFPDDNGVKAKASYVYRINIAVKKEFSTNS